MPGSCTTSARRFPPQTREVPLDEKWSFVYKKAGRCDANNPADDQHGDWWDHVADEAEHRLVLCVVLGARGVEEAEAVVADVGRRTEGRPVFFTSDACPVYRAAILHAYGREVAETPTGRAARRMAPERVPPPGLVYATVETRRLGRVVEVLVHLIFGMMAALASALRRLRVSGRVNVSFLERQNATDRHKNARKVRKTYTFSKDWRVHESMIYFTMYSYNFCWSVRTLQQRGMEGRSIARSPARAAGLADHVWTIREWLTMPSVQPG